MKRILCLVMLFAVIGSTTFLNAQIPRLVYKVIPLTYGFSDNGNRNLPMVRSLIQKIDLLLAVMYFNR